MRKVQYLALACLLAGTALQADTYNKKTKVKFSGPVTIPAPGNSAKAMTLPPGTYVFRLLDSSSNRHIVQVTNERENKVYSTILAVPDYRINASSKTVMYFSERKAGAPVAIKSWFYPGDNYGQRLVYPKVQAVQVATTTNQPVPSHTEAEVTKEVVQAPLAIQTPAKEEVAYTPQTFAKADSTDTAGEDGEAVKSAPEPVAAAAPAPAALPKSASPLQLMAIMGVLLVMGSFILRKVAAQLR